MSYKLIHEKIESINKFIKEKNPAVSRIYTRVLNITGDVEFTVERVMKCNYTIVTNVLNNLAGQSIVSSLATMLEPVEMKQKIDDDTFDNWLEEINKIMK